MYPTEELRRDIQYAYRSSMRRGHRLVSIFTIIIVALGVGTASAMFSVVDRSLIRRLPFFGASQLVNIELFGEHNSALYGRVANLALLGVWQREVSSAAEFGGFQTSAGALRGSESTRPIQIVGITPNTFALLGVYPEYGQNFAVEDDTPEGGSEVILSYDLSKKQFGTAGGAVGKSVVVNGRKLLVIGVMRKHFHIPLSIPESEQSVPEVWITLGLFRDLFSIPREPPMPVEVIARLRPGVNRRALEQQLENVGAEIDPALKFDVGRRERIRVDGLEDAVARSVRTPLLFLSLATLLLLILMCLNVSTLQIANALTLERETATRIALGAPRSRLVLQSIMQSTAMPLLGGILGFGLAFALVPQIIRLGVSYLPGVHTITVDLRVLAFSLLLALAFGIAAGFWPLQTALKRSPGDALWSRPSKRGSPIRRVMPVLAAMEIAFATILLVSMGLLGHSFMRLTRGTRGYDVENVVMGGLILPLRNYPTNQEWWSFEVRLLDNLRNNPEIASAAVSSGAPIIGGTVGEVWNLNGHSGESKVRMNIWRIDGPYFSTLGVPIIHGSQPDFSGQTRDVAIDEAAARLLFGSRKGIGERILWGNRQQEGIVSAIVADTEGLSVDLSTGARLRSAEPHLYVSAAGGTAPVIRIIARSRGNDSDVLKSIRESVASINRDLVVDPLETVRALLNTQLGRERFTIAVIAMFTILATGVGGAGLFAFMFYSVIQRRHEIGVRLALGAMPADIVLLILRDGLVIAGIGTLSGIFGAWAFNRFLISLLLGVSFLDFPTLVGVIMLSTVISLLACLLPALRAATVNATDTLLREQ